MVLKTLRLLSFRAHEETRAAFAPKVNLLYGANGAGKTNLLEAIHYLCLSKSFIATQDGYVLRHGAPYFEVEGTFEGDRRPELAVRLVYVPDEGKKIFVNGAPLDRLADVVGVLPVVVFSPQDHALTAGGPDERRRFLNNILSQARPVYLDDLLKYRRAVKQRNQLLSDYRKRRSVPPRAVQEPWDAELVDLGSRVVAARLRFVHTFSRYLERAYRHIEDVAEHPTITYAALPGLSPGDDVDAVAERYRETLARSADRERQRGITLVGPHRDELVFRLDDLEVRRYASQGQHRTFGMAVKLAKYFYLQDELEERPILLLDDVFDHLDARRSGAFLDIVQSPEVGQSLITATEYESFAGDVPFERPENRTMHVARGGVQDAPGTPPETEPADETGR